MEVLFVYSIMHSVSDLYKLLVIFTICSICVCNVESNSTFNNIANKGTSPSQVKLGQHQIPDTDVVVPHDTINLSSEKRITIPILNKNNNQSESHMVTDAKTNTQIVLEGGEGMLQQDIKTNTRPNTEQQEQSISNNAHSKGVIKGRKGAGQYPGSTVVARKGVEEHIFDDSNKSHINSNHSVSESTSIPQIHSTHAQVANESSTEVHKLETDDKNPQKLSHVKKPEVLSDVGDEDEFEKYYIIKPSTTGQDYVIVGIVIVIGIWFAVFGALIFYRRAEEYWDRRHYRRMDFLVEGMYND